MEVAGKNLFSSARPTPNPSRGEEKSIFKVLEDVILFFHFEQSILLLAQFIRVSKTTFIYYTFDVELGACYTFETMFF